MTEVALPAGVGIASGAAQLLEENSNAVAQAQQRENNMFLRNGGRIVDYGLGAYSLANVVADLNMPRGSKTEMLCSGVAVAARRATFDIGDVILGLSRTVTKSAGGSRMTSRSNSRQRTFAGAGAGSPNREVYGMNPGTGEEILFTKI